MAALPIAIPAVTAAAAYLNARLGLVYDWDLLSTYIHSGIEQRLVAARGHSNLFYILEGHARSSNATHPFLLWNGKTWTYGEAYQMVLKYGSWLKREKGVQKNEVVAMDFVNSEVFIWIWFGLWSIGAKPAFINYNLTGKPLLHSIRTSTSRLVLADAEIKKEFTDEVIVELADPNFRDGKGDVELLFFTSELEAAIESGEAVREPDEARSGQEMHDMAILIYTSGTTGLPKPAIVSWSKARLGSRFIAGWLPLKKDDILYTCMPLYHSSASLLATLSILTRGCTLSLGRRFSHHTFWPAILATNATIIHYVGETCRYLLAAPPRPTDTAHCVRLAYGNGLRPDVWELFKARFNIPTICEFYAATEGPSGMFNKSTNGFSSGAIGRNGALATMFMGPGLAVIKIDPETDPPAPLRDPKTGLCVIAGWDEPGELAYKLDPQNIKVKFQGYFGNKGATGSKILRDVKRKGDAYFSTGDLVRWDRENRWWFVDRIGDTFRWKSENVSTAEVAQALGLCPGNVVKEAAVFGVKVPNHDGRAGCAAVVLDESHHEKTEKGLKPRPHALVALAGHLGRSLPKYSIPLFLRFTRELQTTGTNKHQKTEFQAEGIEVGDVEQSGDVLFWLVERNGERVYERFGVYELAAIKGGNVKL
ncbi:very long-chain acyl-CoA synthetase/fatty acid transporter [Mytilinidion resinicola]|uniref:Very long-chain fatty acid transport protein n=1 Tax=Mytilinidion resinicola TaxID=574789 RepID=A0A6A6Z2R5_9PEZI|nr:very long-chain acyl-CoA synthetase/fatty acid transporter [Mytilinidion resinicola]KAF2815396.1 very long-chain acyl-CoA synthetase/fatty acid transporter [Mytilinidion resinicola]